jgi:hypothetical protein
MCATRRVLCGGSHNSLPWPAPPAALYRVRAQDADFVVTGERRAREEPHRAHRAHLPHTGPLGCQPGLNACMSLMMRFQRTSAGSPSHASQSGAIIICGVSPLRRFLSGKLRVAFT